MTTLNTETITTQEKPTDKLDGPIGHPSLGVMRPLASDTHLKCLPNHHHPSPAIVTFHILEAKFNKDPAERIDPYLKIKLGWHSKKSSIGKDEGSKFTWSEAIELTRKHGQPFAKVKVKDKNKSILNNRVGQIKIELDEVAAEGTTRKWYSLRKGQQVIGEILLEIKYSVLVSPKTLYL